MDVMQFEAQLDDLGVPNLRILAADRRRVPSPPSTFTFIQIGEKSAIQ
jgi:hypothetical protein